MKVVTLCVDTVKTLVKYVAKDQDDVQSICQTVSFIHLIFAVKLLVSTNNIWTQSFWSVYSSIAQLVHKVALLHRTSNIKLHNSRFF